MEAGKLILDDGRVEAFDEALWCTQAAAPAWLAGTGLPLSEFLPAHLLLGYIPHHTLSNVEKRTHPFAVSYVLSMHYTDSRLKRMQLVAMQVLTPDANPEDSTVIAARCSFSSNNSNNSSL